MGKDYDRYIDVQALTVSQGATGEPNPSWASAFSTWARVIPASGGEVFSSQLKKEVTTEVIKFIFRYRSGVTEQHRISYEGKQFDILSIRELGRREELEITGAVVK